MSAATLAGRRILAGAVRAVPALPPRLRRRLIVAASVLAALAAGYQFWLRDSSLVAVEKVTITGLTTKDAKQVRAALESAAHAMTTLHVDRDDLERSISAYPVVHALEVRADFPHGLEIRVIEHRPAALVDGLPVAGDGTILRGMPVEGKLPSIDARANLQGERLRGAVALDSARIAGAAPLALLPRLESIESRTEEGLVVQLRDGPEVIFGASSRVRAKWIAAARVLADPDAAGATYVDVRLPGRPAAGGLPAETVAPVAPAGSADQGTLAPADPLAGDPAAVTTPAPPGVSPAPAASAPAPAEPAPAPAEPAPVPAEPTPAPTDSTGGGAVSAPAE